MQKSMRRSPTRAWALVTLATVGACMALGAMAYFVVATLRSPSTQSRSHQSSVEAITPSPDTTLANASSLRNAMDALARRPMLELPPSAAQPQPLVAVSAGPAIALPKATRTSLLPTGFPRTPEGAVAQLAAIDQAATRNLSRLQVSQIYRWASLPNAVPEKEWNMQVAVNAALRGAGLADTSSEIQFSYTVTHAQIKGVLDEGNFVVACVLGEVNGNYRSTARAGMGDCQRMVWAGGRWHIGAGAQPAYAPNAWPGSADCVRTGWRAVKHA